MWVWSLRSWRVGSEYVNEKSLFWLSSICFDQVWSFPLGFNYSIWCLCGSIVWSNVAYACWSVLTAEKDDGFSPNAIWSNRFIFLTWNFPLKISDLVYMTEWLDILLLFPKEFRYSLICKLRSILHVVGLFERKANYDRTLLCIHWMNIAACSMSMRMLYFILFLVDHIAYHWLKSCHTENHNRDQKFHLKFRSSSVGAALVQI